MKVNGNDYAERMVSMIRKRWSSIALDLQILIDGGTLDNEMSLKEVIAVLKKGPDDEKSLG